MAPIGILARPTVAEERRASGRDVLVVGVLAVAVVLGAAFLTSVLPIDAQR